MKKLILELNQNIDLYSEKGNEFLSSIVSMFNNDSKETLENDFFIPGKSFSFFPEDLEPSDLDSLFEIIVTSNKLMENHEEEAAHIISHIASCCFTHFVDDLAPKLFDASSIPLQFVTVRAARIILDPITGFLRNSPFNPLNDVWHDPEHHFDFFSEESEDRKTPFGLSLDKFRNMIFNFILSTFNFDDYLTTGECKYSVFAPSLFVSVQTTAIPQSLRKVDLNCGFPCRTEVLLALSNFQDQIKYDKTKDLTFEMTKNAKEWSDALVSLFKTKPAIYEKIINLYEGTCEDSPNELFYRFLKLLLFLNIGVTIIIKDEILHYGLKYILGADPALAAFSLMFAQALLLVFPEFSFVLFDDVITAFNNKALVSQQTKFTFLLAISRFVDVLSILPTRYLDDQQIETLISIALIGLCSPYAEMRYISFKAAHSLGNFESNTESLNLYKFFIDNASNFEQFLFNTYEFNPMSIMLQIKLKVLSPLKFQDVLLCRDFLLWQNIIASMGVLISQQFPGEFTQQIKKLFFGYLTNNNINLLTFMSSMLDTPISDSPQDQESLNITKFLLNEMYKTISTQPNHVKSKTLLYTMISQLHTSSFPLCIDLLADSFQDNKAISIFMYSISWNPNFLTIAKDHGFLNKFIDLFSKVCDTISNKKLFDITFDETLESNKNFILKENTLLCNLLTCFYQILNCLYQQFSEPFDAPFPCTNFVIDTKKPLISKTQKFFPFIYNLMKISSTKPKWLHCFSIKNLEMWFACNTIHNLPLLCNDAFLDQLPTICKQAPKLPLHILSHHFDVMFSTFIERSLQPGGECFFSPISYFFKAPSLTSDIQLIDILRTQWSACKNNYSQDAVHKYLQPLYESCGAFILSCLLYMVIPNSDLNDYAFITLSSIAPVLLLFHTGGRDDTVTPLIEAISEICLKNGQTGMSFFDVQTVAHFSEIICEYFQFCMEQLLSYMCIYLPRYDIIIIERVLSVLMPWFSKIKFDIENRVISNETDLLFIRFSCFSFVETLMTAFEDVASDDINSSLFGMWKTLATENELPGNNFLSIVCSIMYLVSSPRYHRAALIIIVYMYRISPQAIIDILSSYLSFNFEAHQAYNDILQNDEMISETTISSMEDDVNSLLNGTHDEDEDPVAVSKKSYHTIIEFVLKMLDQLAKTSVRPLVNSLHIIFSYCVINIDIHFYAIQALLRDIMNELKPYLDISNIPFWQEVFRVIASLGSYYPAVANLEGDEIFAAEIKLSQTIPFTDRSYITRVITHFLESISPEIADGFGLEILKWALCCSNLQRASFAMICYKGNLTITGTLLVGLISRAIWYCYDAIKYIFNESKDTNPNLTAYTRYISECYRTLYVLASLQMEAGTIGACPTFLWIAIEGVKCNSPCLSSIFDASLELLEYLLYPELFNYINGKSQYSAMCYSSHMFTKYHGPWGDRFSGCVYSIFEYTGPNPNIMTMIRVLNNIVQTSYPIMFSESEFWAYTALLSLLPWMWNVIITDINRFFFMSQNVQMMEQTINSFMSFFANDEIILNFFHLMLGDEEVDVFAEIKTVCAFIIPFIPMEDLIRVANFFTNCLIYGPKSFKMPLYSIVIHMISMASDKQQIALAFNEFSMRVKMDKKASRKTYVQMYNEALDEALQSFSAPNQSGIATEELNEKDKNNSQLPDLPIFERIVAVDIPHMYDFTVTEAQTITFNELNSFPPLFPNDPSIFKFDKFKELKNIIKYIKCEPFFSWNDLITKLHTSLIETENVEISQKFETLMSLHAADIMTKIIESIKMDDAENDETKDMQQSNQQPIAQEDEQNQYEELFMMKDAFGFIFLKPEMFVPTVDEANYIGMELFGDDVQIS